MTKVLAVDDSALMRKYLREIFERDKSFEVATARNGRDALEQIERFNPDVVTLDVNMPEMDGLTCLSEIMASKPLPVVMLSSLTSQGAQVTLEALQLGAVDFVEKPGGTVSLNIQKVENELITKVRAAAKAKPRLARDLVQRIRRTSQMQTRPRPVTQAGEVSGLVLIGVSTGGPRTLEDILPELPGDFPFPIVIAQHMPRSFTNSFASRLNNICQMAVLEVSSAMQAKPGHIYIGRGEADVVIDRRIGRLTVSSVPEDQRFFWHPSVERLVTTAMSVCEPENLIGVELTGMGNDGAQAMASLKKAGGRTIAEHESSAIVFGMPAELIKLGGASRILPSQEIAKQLYSWSK